MNQRPTVYVVVPFHFEQQRFKILKGQRWGAIDHLLLQEIVKSQTSANNLSKLSCLPTRLIIEILIPLMKAGWLELISTETEYVFKATERGSAVAKLEQLPLDKEPLISTRQYIIDPSTGDCYRTGHRQQTFQLYSKKRIDELIQSKDNPIAVLDFKTILSEASYTDIFSCVSDRDEEIIAMDDSYIQFSRDQIKYALISVDDSDKIGNAPQNISSELSEQIIEAAHKKLELVAAIDHQNNKENNTHTFQGKNRNRSQTLHQLQNDEYDLILGADKHKAILSEALTEAKTRLIIHSTFINPSNLGNISKSLFELARRSVKIDILWGQVEPTEEGALKSYQNTRDCLSNLIEQTHLEGLDTLINIHLDPTESHSKFIIYDKDHETYSAILGSCNWLNSNFNLFEASLRLCNQNIVAEVIKISSDLVRGASKVSNLFSRELSLLANSLKGKFTQPNINTPTTVRLILKNDHYDLVRKARDFAKKDIFICSHQFSHIAKRPIMAPITTSTNSNQNIIANIFYSKICGGLSEEGAKTISSSLKELNVRVNKISNPAAHAKILTWDEDNAVITSLNWLSASAYGNDLDEIGIHIESQGIAEQIKSEFYKIHSLT